MLPPLQEEWNEGQIKLPFFILQIGIIKIECDVNTPREGIKVEDKFEDFNFLSIGKVFRELSNGVHNGIVETLFISPDTLRGLLNAES